MSIKPLSKLGWLNQHPFPHREVAGGGGSMGRAGGQKPLPPGAHSARRTTGGYPGHGIALSPVVPITGDPAVPETKRLTAGKLLLVRCSA